MNDKKWVYFVAILIVAATLILDQVTKQVASDALASSRGGFVHTIEFVVTPQEDGKTVREAIAQRYGNKNTPAELDRIAASAYNLQGDLQPFTTLKSGDKFEIGWREITVIPNYWDYQYTRNTGAAFSFLADSESPLRTPFFVIVSLISIFVIGYMLKDVQRDQKALLIGLSLVAGGALGNLVDRILYGYVIDFIVWKYGDQYRWPTFNVADAAIVTGVILLSLHILFAPKEEEEKEISEEVSAE